MILFETADIKFRKTFTINYKVVFVTSYFGTAFNAKAFVCRIEWHSVCNHWNVMKYINDIRLLKFIIDGSVNGTNRYAVCGTFRFCHNYILRILRPGAARNDWHSTSTQFDECRAVEIWCSTRYFDIFSNFISINSDVIFLQAPHVTFYIINLKKKK